MGYSRKSACYGLLKGGRSSAEHAVLCAVVSFTLNIIFLYKPILGAPKSSIMAYLKDWGWNRIIAFAAGIICGLGNTFQFMGGQVTISLPPLLFLIQEQRQEWHSRGALTCLARCKEQR